MGATTSIMVLRGLQTGQQYSLGLYFAGGDLAGYIVPCTFNGVASATSPKDFTLPEPCSIEYVSGPATGRLTVDVNGMPIWTIYKHILHVFLFFEVLCPLNLILSFLVLLLSL